MNIEKVKSVYFLGIGGIGMSALARYFNAKGIYVAGYDRTPTPLTGELIAEGINIHYTDDAALLPEQCLHPESTLVVLTPAIPGDHKQWAYFRQNGFIINKRSEVLGLITQNGFTVAVAGTHGKTTTSTLIAHLLRSAGIPCTAFLGGISKNFNSNLLIGCEKDGRHIMVVEADEYDRSFLNLHPDIAVITSMDPDHLDIYGTVNQMHDTYRMFAAQVKPMGCLIHRKDLPVGSVPARVVDYGLHGPAGCYAEHIVISNHQYHFDCISPDNVFRDLTTGLPGEHNVENAVAAVAVAIELGLNEAAIRKGLAEYAGVRRRFDYRVRNSRCVYIDDYAHHPEELRACISSVRDLYPDKKITGVFQPHLFSRTRDFAEGFAKSLSMLDRLILLDIYPARELPMEGVSSKIIFDQVLCPEKTMCAKSEVVEQLAANIPDVLLTLGAGDIDQLVEPITALLHR